MYFFISLISIASFHALFSRPILSINSIKNHVRISLFKAKVHIQNSQQKAEGHAFTFSPVSGFPRRKSHVSFQCTPHYSNLLHRLENKGWYTLF